jgi:epoxyqueuosine reductase
VPRIIAPATRWSILVSKDCSSAEDINNIKLFSGSSEVMQKPSFSKYPEKFIEKAIIQFTQKSPANRRKVGGGKYWGQPLVGFASGDDSLFREYKKIIGKYHLTPREFFELTFGKGQQPKQISVISWVLPKSEDVRKSNRKEDRYPSLLWAYAKVFGEKFNVKLRNHIVSLLTRKGYQAVAPMNSPHYKRLKSPKIGHTSNWSERHVAYACGLGTFGLSDGFITLKGIAHRLGSVVTNLPLKASRKRFLNHQANCLFYFNGTCKRCAVRCPVGAITTRGHDKDKCAHHTYVVVEKARAKEYGVTKAGCGLCQTKVPCEFEIPKQIQKATQ